MNSSEHQLLMEFSNTGIFTIAVVVKFSPHDKLAFALSVEFTLQTELFLHEVEQTSVP